MNLARLLILVALSVPALAQATCLMTCTDADAGDDPTHFGVVTVETSCAAPGGPVHQTRQDYFDDCSGNELREQLCDSQGIPGAQSAQQRIYRCEQCDPVRRGVCLLPSGTPTAAPLSPPTQSCSTVSGGGDRGIDREFPKTISPARFGAGSPR